MTQDNLPNASVLPKRSRNELQQAAASTPAGCNDHNLGHLGLVVSDAEHTTKSNGRPHEPPANPGPSPTTPAVANLDQRDRAIRGRHHYRKGPLCNLHEQKSTRRSRISSSTRSTPSASIISKMTCSVSSQSPSAKSSTALPIAACLKFNETQKEGGVREAAREAVRRGTHRHPHRHIQQSLQGV